MQHVGYIKSDSVGKGRSDAKKEAIYAGVCVQELERVVPRASRSSAYSTCCSLSIQIGVLVGCWECSQDILSRQLPPLRLPGLPALQRASALSKPWLVAT